MPNTEALKQASVILDRILAEEPAFWPYGLSVDQFDGGLYLLSKQAGSDEYVGFVGWQEREEAQRRVGYYAIGVLPEYRRQGLAKAAVQKIIAEKSAGVDEVRALVMANNEPSKNLARSVPGVHLTVMEKLAALQKSATPPIAGLSKGQQALTALIGALGSTALFDQTADPDGRSLESTLQPWKWDKKRQLMGAFNAILGAGGAHQLRSGIRGNSSTQSGLGIAAILSAPGKDLMLKGTDSLYGADKMMAAVQQAANRPSKSIADSISKPMLYSALGLGAGALGLAGYASLRGARAADAQAAAAGGGRVKVTLPTKDPNDAETILDIPIEEMNLSTALRSRLSRDTRRKLYEETRKRTHRRKPKDPNAPTEPEKELLQLAEEEAAIDKAAAAGPQPAVPSPPGQGNPALRMTQQQSAAKSIDTSTQANPQIMKAQQDAASASMEAQQQVAQAEQQTQQQLMEQQQGFQQQLQKADQDKQQVVQENQALKMKLEQAKIESDLVKTKVKAKEEISKLQGDAANQAGTAKNDQLNQLIGSRLQRVQKNLSKAATTSPWGIEVDTKRNPPKPWEIDAVTGNRGEGSDLDPTTGKPKPPPIKALHHDAAQQINDNGFEYMAQGRAPGIHMYRASYGKLGDMLYNYTLKPYLTTPPPKQDLNVIGDMRRYGEQLMHAPRF